ncbi:MBL fold metallo-hydrolase [Streptomyces sp. NPDC059900]|uniref:MBL fold metallo-hydrolase n=1 Tax=Streptomyces sp. NPDC059900 TaxID=3155816 RepID=UPI003430E0D1
MEPGSTTSPARTARQAVRTAAAVMAGAVIGLACAADPPGATTTAGSAASAEVKHTPQVRRALDDATRATRTTPFLQNARVEWCRQIETVSPTGNPPAWMDQLADRDTRYNGEHIFENVVFLGYPGTSAYAIKTTEGIVLVDALWNESDARDVIVPGLTAAGLDPKNITRIVLTHEHEDHYGGAAYLKKTYGAKIVAGAAGEASLPATLKPLAQAISGPTTLSFGSTQMHLLPTPGHTPGTVSITVTVRDFDGRRHVAGIWGGTAQPAALEGRRQMAASLAAFRTAAERQHVDSVLSTHPFLVMGTRNIDALRERGTRRNPFVIGEQEVRRNFAVMTSCVKAGVLQKQR